MKVSQINRSNQNFKGFISIKNVEKIERKSPVRIPRLVLNTNDIYKITPLETTEQNELGVEIITKYKEIFKIPAKDEKGGKRLFNRFLDAIIKAEKNGFFDYI